MDLQSKEDVPLAAMAQGLAPVARSDARVLILGSIPGIASIRAGQYYAHPQNLFWPIICAYFDIDVGACYAERVAALLQRQTAIWDVLQACERSGSLDSAVKLSSARRNNFGDFFSMHPHIQSVVLNGKLAARQFRQFVLPELAPHGQFHLFDVPSTSPANAALPAARRAENWFSTLRRAHDIAFP